MRQVQNRRSLCNGDECFSNTCLRSLCEKGQASANESVDHMDKCLSLKEENGKSLKSNVDGDCKNNSGCFSDSCFNGKCQKGNSSVNQTVDYQDQCSSLNIENGKCIKSKVGGACNNESDCFSNKCINTKCERGDALLLLDC